MGARHSFSRWRTRQRERSDEQGVEDTVLAFKMCGIANEVSDVTQRS